MQHAAGFKVKLSENTIKYWSSKPKNGKSNKKNKKMREHHTITNKIHTKI